MRNRIDLRTLFQSLEDPAPSDGFVGRVMRQVAAANRPIEAPAPAPRLLPFPMHRWARVSAGAMAAAAMLLLGGATLLVPSTWLTMLSALETGLFSAVWILTWTAGVLAESLPFLNGAVRVGEALDLILRTPQVTAGVTVAALVSLAAVYLLHRLASGPGSRRRVRGARAGALLLVGGLCCTGLAFGQPQEAQEAQEEASAALEEARETLDEVLEEAGEQAQGAIEGAIERLEDLERDLNGIDKELVDLDNKVAFGSTVRVGRGEVAYDIVSIGRRRQGRRTGSRRRDIDRRHGEDQRPRDRRSSRDRRRRGTRPRSGSVWRHRHRRRQGAAGRRVVRAWRGIRSRLG